MRFWDNEGERVIQLQHLETGIRIVPIGILVLDTIAVIVQSLWEDFRFMNK